MKIFGNKVHFERKINPDEQNQNLKVHARDAPDNILEIQLIRLLKLEPRNQQEKHWIKNRHNKEEFLILHQGLVSKVAFGLAGHDERGQQEEKVAGEENAVDDDEGGDVVGEGVPIVGHGLEENGANVEAHEIKEAEVVEALAWDL